MQTTHSLPAVLSASFFFIRRGAGCAPRVSGLERTGADIPPPALTNGTASITMALARAQSSRRPGLSRVRAALLSLAGLSALSPLTDSSCQAGTHAASEEIWVGTWTTAPQLVEPGNMPPAPGLANNSLRQVVRVSIGGDTLRVKFSNEFGTGPVTMNAVHIAASAGGSTIALSTDRELKFGGVPSVTMGAGTVVTTDPIAFPLTPRMDVAITIYFGQTSSPVTGHPGSRTTSYIVAGNTPATTDFTGAVTTDHWYDIDAIDVLAPSTAGAVAILGNSITDGRGSTTNMHNRWPDVFSESLRRDSSTQRVGVLNQGIGGNCVLAGGLGPTGVSRYDRDILGQSAVRWAIVLEGVNDIGGVTSAGAATTVAANLINAYAQMILKAHGRNVRIYGATILPFKGNGYFNQYSESCRETVNQWIRTPGNFDACIDFDRIMRDPQDTLRLVSTYQNDGLHPDTAGYRKMGLSIDLSLFAGADTLTMGLAPVRGDHGFSLDQNYPNPPNSPTVLPFALAACTFVTPFDGAFASVSITPANKSVSAK